MFFRGRVHCTKAGKAGCCRLDDLYLTTVSYQEWLNMLVTLDTRKGLEEAREDLALSQAKVL